MVNFVTGISLGMENIFAGYKIYGVPFYRGVQFIIFIYFLRGYVADLLSVSHHRVLRLFTIVVMSFIVLFLFSTFLKIPDSTYFIRHSFRLISMIMVFYITYRMISSNYKLLNIVLLIQGVSFVVAFFQFHGSPFVDEAWWLKMELFINNVDGNDLLVMNQLVNRERIAGIHSFAITLSYSLLSASFLSLYLYIKTNNKMYYMFFVFCGLVILMSLTRSAVAGYMVVFLWSIFYMYQNADKRNKSLFISFVFVILLVVLYFSYGFLIQLNEAELLLVGRMIDFTEGSAGGRIPLLIAGVLTLLYDPLGFMPERYEEVKMLVYDMFGNRAVYEFSPHNGFITIGLRYTLLGLLVFVFFVVSIIKMIKLSVLNRYVKQFFIVSLFAYMVNVFFHNNIIFIQDFFIITFFSVIAYEVNLLYKTELCVR